MSAITIRAIEPEPAPSRIWEISYEGQCPTFQPTPLRAATTLVDILTRRQMKGWPDRTITVRLIDEADETIWDATADVAAVLTATGWPGPGSDRDSTISILEAILVTDESVEDEEEEYEAA